MAARRVSPKPGSPREKRAARITAAEATGVWPSDMSGPPSTADLVSPDERLLWNPKNRAEILRYVEEGNPMAVAFGAVVSTFTWWCWAKRAKAGEAEFVEFFRQVSSAENRALVNFNAMLRAAARGDTITIRKKSRNSRGEEVERVAEVEPDAKAIQFFLERRGARRGWGRLETHEVTGRDGGPVAVANSSVPFRFDPQFRGWTNDELRKFATTGVVPERFASGQAAEVEPSVSEIEQMTRGL